MAYTVNSPWIPLWLIVGAGLLIVAALIGGMVLINRARKHH